MNTPSVGFIGLGFMGHGMAHHILTKGFPLTVMAHKKRAAVDDLVGKGAVEVEELSALAASVDVIVLVVSGQEQVDDLVRRENGIGANARAGTLVIDCTTSRPDTLLALQADFPELRFLDCPMGRSPKEAWEGKLSVMVGGATEELTRARPVIEAFADTVQYVGKLGAGHSLKLVNNMVSLGYAALYAEALTMTEKSGIPLSAFDALISSSRMDCAFFQTFMGWVRNGDATSHKFALSVADHALTDVREHAQAEGLSLPVLNAVGQIYAEAVEEGAASANLPELPRVTAAHHGVSLKPMR